MMFEGHDLAKLSQPADEAAAPRGADDLPGPLHLAEPAAHRRCHRRHAAVGPQHRAEEADPAARAGAAGGRGSQPRALQPLPQRVLRRPAPAHRHRPRAHPEPQAAGRRRAGLGPRRLDPGAGDQPAPGPAEGVRHRVPVHRPRPGDRAALLPRGRGDVPRQDRRDRRPGDASTGTRTTRTRRRCSPRCRTSSRRRSAAAASGSGSRATYRARSTRRPAAGSAPAASSPRRSARRWSRRCSRSASGTRWPATSPASWAPTRRRR